MSPTKSRPEKPKPDTYGLSEALATAMRFWARRDREPAGMVEQAINRLHETWAAVCFAPSDEPTAASGRRGNAKQTASARKYKSIVDADRERYIVKRYSQVIRRARTAKEAREIVAAEIRAGKHFTAQCDEMNGPAWLRDLLTPPASYAGTYSEKSVARVLKRFAKK